MTVTKARCKRMHGRESRPPRCVDERPAAAGAAIPRAGPGPVGRRADDPDGIVHVTVPWPVESTGGGGTRRSVLGMLFLPGSVDDTPGMLHLLLLLLLLFRL